MIWTHRTNWWPEIHIHINKYPGFWGENIPVALLAIVDCQGYLADGNKKYGTFTCNQFLKHMKEIDPTKKLSDIVMFDGASNVQLAIRLFKVNYTKLTVMRGVEHTLSLFSMIFLKYPLYIKSFLSTR